MKTSNKFNHKMVENHWKHRWENEAIYTPDLNQPEKSFYNLWMFPYPSAEGVHVGTIFSSTGSDVFGRYMRMKGCEVFQPIGFDSFGIHSENYAIKINENPKIFVGRAVNNYANQFKMISHGYDWTRTVTTSKEDYYKWTQWLFKELFKAGLAYKKNASVNWCASCKTVLADEQVMTPTQAGKVTKDSQGNVVENDENSKVCERCGTIVEKKELDQWFLRITRYADNLLEGLKKIDWSEKVVIAQRNWIGKKEGINITYPINDSNKKVTVWTSRPDTNFGATFIVISPEYAQKYLTKIIPKDLLGKVKDYIKISLTRSKEDRIAEGRKKTGVSTGLSAINQLNGYSMPVWVADFVLADVGTGAVVGVPGHDKRDFEFAKEFGLNIKRVVVGSDNDKSDITGIKQVQEEDGIMVNSEFLDGMNIHKAIQEMMKYLEEKGWGKRSFNYHLRDWLISRQRYWGAPTPMIYCEKCAQEGKSWLNSNSAKEFLENSKFKSDFKNKIIENLELGTGNSADWSAAGWYPEENLPVILPDINDFKPEGGGKGPLANHPEFYKTVCPDCSSEAKRETDVMDTFVDSSWYFLRYPSTRSARSGQVPFETEITKNWLPVDLYFGGAEHSVLHLMYARFVTMALHDMGYLNFEEPFPRFFAHGLMIKDGAKMSKSRGNVVNPDEYIEKFGADTLRLYLMFMGPMDGFPDFRDTGIEGMRRFIDKIWGIFWDYKNVQIKDKNDIQNINIKMHQTIKKVSEDIQKFKYNTAISAIMEYVNILREVIENNKESRNKIQVKNDIWNEALKTLALLLAPFAPHLCEEVWVNVLGQEFSINKASWPEFDINMVFEDEITIAVQVNGKLRATVVINSNDSDNKEIVSDMAKSNEKIKIWLKDKEIRREIFIPGKILNIISK